MRLPVAPYFRTAALVCALAIIYTGSALVRAIRIPPVSVPSVPADPTAGGSLTTPPVPSIDIEAVGANDIFQPDRSAMPARYRMPGDAVPDAGAKPEPEKPIVLGTVLSMDGRNYATCQITGGKPVIVHVGDRIGLYTVVSIEKNKVVFKSPSGALIEIAPL